MTEPAPIESVLDHTTLLLPHLYSREMRSLPILDGASRLVGSISSFGAELGPTSMHRPATITVSDATGDVLRVCDPPQRGMPLGGFWANGGQLVFLTPHTGLGRWQATGHLADGTAFQVLGTRTSLQCFWNGTQIAHGTHLQPGASPSGLLATSMQIDPRAPRVHRAAVVAGHCMMQRQWAYERESARRDDDDLLLYWSVFD